MPSASTTRSSLGDRYRVLLEIGRKLTGTLAVEDLYRSIYAETAQVLEASGFYISLYDPDTDLARVVFYADKGEEIRCDITYRGSDSDVIRLGKATSVEDRLDQQSVMLLGDEDSEVTRSAISAPLMLEGEVIGAISTQSYQARAYNDGDLELLFGIADLAAIAVANARRMTELERRRREAEQIEEIGRALTSSLDFDEVVLKVASSAIDLLDVDGAAVWLIEGRTATCRQSVGSVRIPLDTQWELHGSIYRTLCENAEPFEIEDFSETDLVPEDLKGLDLLTTGSGLSVPLIVENKVAGALTCGCTATRAFSADDRQIMMRLARQASVALDNARLHQDLQALSLTDALTGLPNRRHMEMHLGREVAAAQRGRSLCLVIFDLDDFKVYNDTLGHLVGDGILRAFADVLAKENRAMNLVARFGGDEFVSILSESDEAGAHGYLERVRQRIRSDPTLSKHEVGVSCGLALFDPETMGSPHDLIEVADRDMYADKVERR